MDRKTNQLRSDFDHFLRRLRVRSSPQTNRQTNMRTHGESLELAEMCARNARIASNKDVARELWKMAQEYQAEVASLVNGALPELGDPPSSMGK